MRRFQGSLCCLCPPAVIILDPVSGKVIKRMVSQGDMDKEGKSLPAVIKECWKNFQEEKNS